MAGMICAPEAFAVEIGADVLARGGNAVDAAVTCAFAQGVLDPHDSSIGGYLVVNVHRAADGPARSQMLDAPATAGSLASDGMWADEYLGPNPDNWGFFLRSRANELGYTSICTPGTVRGLAALLERWGTITFAEAVEPAARLADEGFAVDNRVAAYWLAPAAYPEQTALIDYIRSNPEASKIYLKPEGGPYLTGEVIRNPDYARTLRHLGAAGPEDFYTGSLATRIAADLAAHGSFVTADDLEAYRPRDVEPLVGTYRDVTISTTQAPHGGPTLLEILNIAEGWDLRGMGHNTAPYVLKLAAAMKAAFADRNGHLGDPDFVDVPLEWLTSKQRAAEWRDRIDAGEEIRVPTLPGGSPATTHVSVVDGRGTCVSLTHSLGGSSGVISPGMGFMYNNSMINFHPLPGHPNSIAPGKGRTTGMAPTIVDRHGRPILVIGAPGGTRIITSIAQVLINVLDFGMSAQEAVLAARFDCQSGPISAQIRIPRTVVDEVALRHPIRRMPMAHGGIGLVHAVAIDEATGTLSGGADAGSAGMAIRT